METDAQKIEKLEAEKKLLQTTIDYILMLEARRNPHLGRPRLTDKKCIFCIGYFALNNGAFGENLTQETLDEARRELTNNKA